MWSLSSRHPRFCPNEPLSRLIYDVYGPRPLLSRAHYQKFLPRPTPARTQEMHGDATRNTCMDPFQPPPQYRSTMPVSTLSAVGRTTLRDVAPGRATSRAEDVLPRSAPGRVPGVGGSEQRRLGAAAPGSCSGLLAVSSTWLRASEAQPSSDGA